MDHEAAQMLEVKISYLEKGGVELSDAMFQQQVRIDRLEAQVKALQARLAALVSGDVPRADDDEKPPHY